MAADRAAAGPLPPAPSPGPGVEADVAIVGGGAAGLATAIFAGRASARAGGRARIVVLDGAARLGAKLLVSGGGRCNVTHDTVDETAFSGSTPPAIRKVLRRLDVPSTIELFRGLGVELVREPGGKLFPVSGRARTVLDALVNAARDAGADLVHPWRVESVARRPGGFELAGPAGAMRARRVVLATGGFSLPRSGSDGAGHRIARELGHGITARVFPALVPLVVAEGFSLRGLSGVSAPARVEVRSGTGRVLAAFTGPVLCTHFGLSGPAVLDASRYWTAARGVDPAAALVLDWLPAVGAPRRAADALARTGVPAGRWLREAGLPQRLAEALCAHAGVDPRVRVDALSRAARRALLEATTALPVPVVGDRGFGHAEVTAGGIPLREVRLDTMESRCCPGLHLVGEICDVDGRIGGYNFQWAWASARVAGEAVGAARPADPAAPGRSAQPSGEA